MSKGKATPKQPGNPRSAVFHPDFIEDLRYWIKVALRALDTVEDTLRDPLAGIGKPEHLKYLPAGTWPRRLTQEHRIVYQVKEEQIHFVQARYHY